MKEQTALPLETEIGETPHLLAEEPQSFALTPPPIPWEELDRRHDAAANAG